MNRVCRGEGETDVIREPRAIKSAEVIHELPRMSNSGAIRESRLPGEGGGDAPAGRLYVEVCLRYRGQFMNCLCGKNLV